MKQIIKDLGPDSRKAFQDLLSELEPQASTKDLQAKTEANTIRIQASKEVITTHSLQLNIASISNIKVYRGEEQEQPKISFYYSNGMVIPFRIEQGGDTLDVITFNEGKHIQVLSTKQKALTAFCDEWVKEIRNRYLTEFQAY